MFTTLRYIKDTALVPEREGHVLSHLACKACRTRKLKCTGESTGCRRCLSKDITCSYPDPSQRTRRKDVQRRTRQNQISQIPLPPPPNPTQTVASYAPNSHELTTLANPWTEAPFQNWNEGFLDGLLGNSSLSQELNFLGDDIQVEGAKFFSLDHYECLNRLLGATSTDLSPTLSLSASTFPAPSNPLSQKNSSLSLPPAPTSPSTDQSACLPTALQLLSLHTTSSHLTIPNTIRLNKHILRQSLSMFSCTTCTAATAGQIITILTVLSQKIITSYEKVIAVLARRYYALSNQTPEKVPTFLRIHYEDEDEDGELGGDRVEGQEGEDWRGGSQLCGYEVEKCEEPCLFSGLVTLQLGILRAFLVRLKEAPEGFVREYVGLLDEVDGRVMKLGRFCSQSCSV